MLISRFAQAMFALIFLGVQPVVAQEAKENKSQKVVENKNKLKRKQGLAKWEKDVIINLDLLQNLDLLENMELIEDLPSLQGDTQ